MGLRHHCPSTFLHSRRIITNLSKMSEVDAKTDAPTAEEIKGTKRAAEDEVEEAKKQKTENGSNGKAAVIEVENGADEEEEDGEEEEDLVEGEEDEADPEEEEDLDEGDDAEGEEEEDGDEEIVLMTSFNVFCIPNPPIMTTI